MTDRGVPRGTGGGGRPPPPTLYHRWLGWHAPAVRRATVVTSAGAIVIVLLSPFVVWALGVCAGWDVASVVFLAAVWPIVIRADAGHLEYLARREDESRGSGTLLLLSASVSSLLGVGFTLSRAGAERGQTRMAFIGVAVLTVVLSWTVVNTVYTLRYAHLNVESTPTGVDFGGSGSMRPTYRDFAYVAFTIGMTYQVSDTAISDPRIRRTILAHALLSYLFGVVIVAGSVNLIAGLVQPGR